MLFAVLPAGGHSMRMGRPKLALPLGDRTVLEHVIAALRAAKVNHILVVLGPHVAELRPLAESAGAHVHVLAEATPDMRTTVERGLRWLEDRFPPSPDDGWLLVPADHPTLRPEVVRQLTDAQKRHPQRSIFVPTYQAGRGHPTLIAWSHVQGMRALPAGVGINTYLRKQIDQTLEVAVDSAEILLDLDTPEDYERLLRAWTAPKGSQGVNPIT
jgi:molybdenum cofactor cytidylyltransferase